MKQADKHDDHPRKQPAEKTEEKPGIVQPMIDELRFPKDAPTSPKVPPRAPVHPPEPAEQDQDPGGGYNPDPPFRNPDPAKTGLALLRPGIEHARLPLSGSLRCGDLGAAGHAKTQSRPFRAEKCQPAQIWIIIGTEVLFSASL